MMTFQGTKSWQHMYPMQALYCNYTYNSLSLYTLIDEGSANWTVYWFRPLTTYNCNWPYFWQCNRNVWTYNYYIYYFCSIYILFYVNHAGTCCNYIEVHLSQDSLTLTLTLTLWLVRAKGVLGPAHVSYKNKAQFKISLASAQKMGRAFIFINKNLKHVMIFV